MSAEALRLAVVLAALLSGARADEDPVAAAVAKAKALREAGATAGAAEALERFVTVEDPSAPEAWYWLGICRLDLADLDGAVEALGRARRLAPRNAAIALALGNAYFVRLEKDRAAEEYRQVLAIDPDNDSARQNLVTIRDDVAALESFMSRSQALFGLVVLEIVALSSAIYVVLRACGDPTHPAALMSSGGRKGSVQSEPDRL